MSSGLLNTAAAQSIQEKYQALQDAYCALHDEVAQYHSELELRGKTARELFSTLSRILAHSDHLQLILSIMEDDVVAIEPEPAGPPTAEDEWWSEHADEWLRAMDSGSCKVH